MNPDNDLTAAWRNPPAIYRAAPFWAWNARLDPDRLCRAIESMHAAGMGGFFMHSRYGLKTPYLSDEWFECVSACIEKARQLGMKAYLYDEDRWPSGAAGGQVTRDRQEFRMHYLLAAAAGAEAESGEPLASFALRLDESGRLADYRPADRAEAGGDETIYAFDVVTTQSSGWYNAAAYLDTMNAQAVDEFLRVTHQAYADRFAKDFGELIPAIFTDEPNYYHMWHSDSDAAGVHRLPWTPQLPNHFMRRRGYDLRDKLPELVLPLVEGDFSKARHDYYLTLCELFVENFSRRVGLWCGENGIALTGHMLSEETLASQTQRAGAAMPHYEHMQWPGIDLLGDQTRELSTAKQCSSVADQLGKQRVLSELYGCTGWDWPLEGHKFIGDWQYACGINFRCPHLTHYSLAGGAKRDYPASIFTHSPWWQYYRAVEDYFARLGLMLTQGRPLRDVLVIHPIQSAWGLFRCDAAEQSETFRDVEESFAKLIRSLSNNHYDWDFGDESLLAEHARASGASLDVGLMTYRLVVVPPCVTLRRTTVALLQGFLAGGGKVLFVGRTPALIDGERDDGIDELLAASHRCGGVGEAVAAVEAVLPRRVSITEGAREAQFVWAMLREVGDGHVLFVQSHDRKQAHRVHVSVGARGPTVLWDARTGTRTKLASAPAGDRVEFDLELHPTGSALVSLGISVPDAEDPAAPPLVAESRTVEGPFRFELAEPNTMPLDYCTFSVGDEDFSAPVATLEADRRIREHFGLEPRTGSQCQPWYLYAAGTVDVSPRGRCRLRWAFHATDVPGRCHLALENPQDYGISVNGRAVQEVAGYWVDEDIKTIDITSLVRPGDNEVLLTFDYRPDMELEDAYLVGDFGVAVRDGSKRQPGALTLVAVPTELRVGSWLGQGLDFYGGAVRYLLTIERPADGRVRIDLGDVACTAAAIHVGQETFPLPWGPFAADITDALAVGTNQIVVEVIGGRKNILGPLHTPWEAWTGPSQFQPDAPNWTSEYLLNDHGLMSPVTVQILK